MKIKSLESLQDKLDSDFAWRRKELTSIYSNVQKASDKKIKTELRIGIVMLYAHWEGFVKNICEYYVNYVSLKRLKYSELNDNFVAIEMKRILDNSDDNINANKETNAVKFIRENLSIRSNIKLDIETRSNLNSTVLYEILLKIGLDFSPYSTKSKLIDEKLLKNRNGIAHGNYLNIDKEDYEIIYTEIISMMTELKNSIANYATMKYYKKSGSNIGETEITDLVEKGEF